MINFLRLRIFQSIRGQLLASLIIMILLPVLGISAGSLWIGFINGRQQAFDRLESASALKQIEIERWLDEIKNETSTALTEEYAYERILTALSLAAQDRYFRFYNGAIRNRFEILASQSSWFYELLLLDRQGKVVIATNTVLEGADLSNLDCFVRTQTQPAFQLFFTEAGQEPVIYVGIPVFDLSDQLMGVILSQSKAASLVEILQDTTGMGSSGFAYLASPTAISISASEVSSETGETSFIFQETHSEVIERLLAEHTTISGIFRNPSGKRVLGVYRWLPSLEMGLAIEQDFIEALSIVFSSLTVTVWVSLSSLVIGVVLSLWLTRRITQPLTQLADAAQHISDSGLAEEVKIERRDEIGILANAFNTMTNQLGRLIGRLEQRVAERTAELEEANQALNRRARQVETSFKLGRQITSILEIQPLLQRIVDLIRQSFGYEQVLVYLSEEQNNHLVLHASSPFQENQYRTLRLDQHSLNGSCALSGTPIVVNDVREDERYLPEKELSVLAEMVVPLMVAGEVIGTLDVQSTQLNAFTDEDVLGFQNLADQIAIAIQNARLYARTRELAVLEERNRLSRELHDSVIQSLYSLNLLAGGWQRLLQADQHQDIPDYLQRVRQISEQALREMRLLVHQLRPPFLEEEGLLDALHQRLDAVEKRAGIDARLIVEDVLELPVVLEEPFYWIAQEALNNALKHGAPTAVSIRLWLEDQNFALEVSDDGCGFDLKQAQSSGGMGLRTMKERAEAIQADLIIQTALGQGTRIRVIAPSDEDQTAQPRV